MNFVQDPSLSLYLPLYERGGASLMSRDAYGHVCTVTGATWSPAGRTFDGNDDGISVPDHNALDVGTGNFSMGAWAKVDVVSDYATMIWKSANQKGYFMRLDITTGYFRVGIIDGSSGSSYTEIVQSTDYSGAWHLFFVTIDRDSATGCLMYVDGVSVKTGDMTAMQLTLSNTGSLDVGIFGALYPLEGSIGEVWLYNGRVLTPLEIQRNYLATKWRYQ